MVDEIVMFTVAKGWVESFCTARDWDQFHSPKDLAIGIETESAELLSLFRFKSESEVGRLLNDSGFRTRIGEELADIQYFLLRFAQMYQFDLSGELRAKLKVNEKRYPISKSGGSSKKHNEL